MEAITVAFVQKVKSMLGMADAGGQRLMESYRCGKCGEAFESAKDRDRVSCPECLSHDIEHAEEH